MDLTLIIGYGNSLRGDDALGPLAAQALLQNLSRPDVEILALHQLTPELAERISRASLVIFIDTSVEGEPGEICERPVEAAVSSSTFFTHHASPEGLIAGSRALYGRAPEACLISVVGTDFSYSMDPSPELHQRVRAVVNAVLRKLTSQRK